MLRLFELTPTFLAHLSQRRRLPLVEIIAPAVEWLFSPACRFAAGNAPKGIGRRGELRILGPWERRRKYVHASATRAAQNSFGGKVEASIAFPRPGLVLPSSVESAGDVMARSARPTRSCNMCSNATRYSIGPDGAISRNSLVGV
jgi:hypothetical protein